MSETKFFSIGDDELEELGYFGQNALKPEVRERCRYIPAAFDVDVERVIGRKSDAVLANRIAILYPPLYRRLKRQAIKKGIIAG